MVWYSIFVKKDWKKEFICIWDKPTKKYLIEEVITSLKKEKLPFMIFRGKEIGKLIAEG